MTATRLPLAASAAPRFDAVTVLPVPPFGPSTQIIAPVPRAACGGDRAPARDDLLEREPDALRRLGQADDVVGAHLEEPAEEAVGRRLREDDDRQAPGARAPCRRSARARAPSSRSRR